MPVTQRSIEYWEKRAIERQKAYEATLSQFETRLRYNYDVSFKNIEEDIQNNCWELSKVCKPKIRNGS